MSKNENKMEPDSTKILDAAERDIIVADTVFHVKSIFTGKRGLKDALKNIILRKTGKRPD